MPIHYGFAGKFMAKPRKRDDLLGILLEAAAVLQDNRDCLLYVMSTRDTEPDSIWSTEIWTSKSAHDASLKLAEVQAIIQRAMPLIAGMGEITELDVAGGKGLNALSASE